MYPDLNSGRTRLVLMTLIFQGLLYHFLITDFLCFGCFNRYVGIPGLSILQVPLSPDPTRPTENLKQSNCHRAHDASKAEYEELQRYLEAKNMPVSNSGTHFFSKNPQVPVLPDMVVHGQEHDFDIQDWNDAYGGVKNIIWTLISELDLHVHLFVFAKFRSTCATIEDKKQEQATKLSATLRWSMINNIEFFML